MSKTTTNLLLVVTLFAAVAVHSVSSAVADTVTLTNSSFYKEKGYGKLVATGDASIATTVAGRQLIAGKNSKTNYYIYQTNTASDKLLPNKGGSITIVVQKVDVNKLAFVSGSSSVTLTGFKWGGTSSGFQVGASVGNNITLVGRLYADPTVENPLKHLYVYLVDLDKNEKTEVLVASAIYTNATDGTTVSLVGVHSSNSLTVIIYTLSASTATTQKDSTYVVTLKGGKLGTPSLIKEISSTSTDTSSTSLQDWAGTGENLYFVYQTSDANSLKTETVYPFTVTEKEVKAGTSAVLNAQVALTNLYGYSSILGHSEGRWVALYSNSTTVDTTVTQNLVAKASNDTTGFKTIQTYVQDNTGKTSKDLDQASTYFGGLVLFTNEGSTSSDGTSVDQYTYSYQTFGGDLASLGVKTSYLMTSGKYASRTNPSIYRLGDSKAYNLLVEQIAYNATADPTTTYEGVYFGQIFQKSFGATLQSILAVCSLMLATLFIF